MARAQGAARIVLAVPIAPRGWTQELAGVADELVCVHTVEPFFGVGMSYRDFDQTSDEEVAACLDRAAVAQAGAVGPRRHAGAADRPRFAGPVEVPAGPVSLHGDLIVPEASCGTIVFAHGSGSSRHSPRNRFVASVLQRGRARRRCSSICSPPTRSTTAANVFDIELLARRLLDVTAWLRSTARDQRASPVALLRRQHRRRRGACGRPPTLRPTSRAVVSRGGRPDLAAERLAEVRAPTLLIVGGRDEVVLELNRQAPSPAAVREPSSSIVPGATHLFEEPGSLETVAALATGWFLDHLLPPVRAVPS